MSCYDKEYGVLTLPSAALVPLRRALIAAVNAESEKTLAIATQVFDHLHAVDPTTKRKTRLNELKALLRKGGSNGYLAQQALRTAMDSLNPQQASRNTWFPVDRSNEWSDEQRDAVISLLLPYPGHGNPIKLATPLKKNIKLLPASTLQFHNDYCSVRIDPKARTVTWSVERNNRAVESAHESVLGREFLLALGTIEWTRGTGGAFRYSDEYSEDAGFEHGYNPVRISLKFGSEGDKEYEAETGYNPRTRRASPTRRMR